MRVQNVIHECINAQDADGLSSLMTQDHMFIDREGGEVTGKGAMTKGWIQFFEELQFMSRYS